MEQVRINNNGSSELFMGGEVLQSWTTNRLLNVSSWVNSSSLVWNERSGRKMMKKQFKIVSMTGFAYPATLIVSVASKSRSTISLKYNGLSINLSNSPNSILELMSLGVKPGTYVEITANGCDEQAALQMIENSLSEKLYIANWNRQNHNCECS